VTPGEAAARGEAPFRRSALIIFVVAVIVRGVHLWYLRRSPFLSALIGDSRQYDAWAVNLAGGDWIGSDVFYQAPLYPYFLGMLYTAFGRDLLIVHVVQILLGSAACVAVGLTAMHLFSAREGLIAGLLMALYAPAIFLEGLIQKSILDSVLVSLIILLTAMLVNQVSRGLWVGLGAALGALCLTRENALILALIALTWAGIDGWRQYTSTTSSRGPASSAIALLVGLLMVLGPVLIRNTLVGGGFYLTTAQLGPNFYIGNNARATGTYQGLREGREDPAYERQDAIELAEHALNRRLTPAEVSSFWMDQALTDILQQPARWFRLLGRKLILLVNATEMMDTEAQESHAEWSPVLQAMGWFLHFGTLLPLALIGVLVTWSERHRLWILYAMAIGYGSSVVLFYVVARYRFPIVPFVVVFAAAGLAGLPSLLRNGSWREQAIAGVVAIAAALVAHSPAMRADTMRAITETNYGAAFHEQGRLEEAVSHYRRAVAIRPDYAPAHNNLGQALRAQGRVDEAIAEFRHALVVQPNVPEVHYNLATILVEQRRYQDSLPHFAAARVLPPTARRHNNHGAALAAVNRLDEAIMEFRAALALSPDATLTLKNLGDALARQSRYPEALTHYRRIAELQPQNAEAHYDLAGVLMEARRLPEAEAAFRATTAIAPDSAQAHTGLGVSLAAQGKMTEAIEAFRIAVKLNPESLEARNYLERAL
jgi:tetratricopeptide (TPR) repeat protein